MSKVRLEVLSYLVEKLDADAKGDTIVLEQEIGQGTVVRDILNRLSSTYPRFTEVIFDVKAQKQTEKVNIFLNGRNLELENGLSTRLVDGDTLTFVAPVIGG